MTQNFEVAVRVRPLSFSQKEEVLSYEKIQAGNKKNSKSKVLKMNPAAYSFYSKFYDCNINDIVKTVNNKVLVADPQYKNVQKKMKEFHFSNVLGTEDNNHNLFKNVLSSNIDLTLKGFNCAVMAYGITGSGKTHTVFGENRDHQDSGISYLSCDYLIKKSKQMNQEGYFVKLKFSFLQIYNENIRDLLSDENKIINIVDDSKGGTILTDLKEIQIIQYQNVSQLISSGFNRRIRGSTQANQCSSRSHAIMQINIQIQTPEKQCLKSKLFIIDLAGSQKIQTYNSTKKNNEGANINKSLLALGNCINFLAQNSRRNNNVNHIPYRDSKLTRILKDSLGGNSKTVMIACMSLNPFTVQETLTTLNYASRAQGIKKTLEKNHTIPHSQIKEEIICSLCQNKISKDNLVNNQNRPENPIYSGNLHEFEKIQEETSDKNNNESFINLFNQIYDDIVDNVRENQKILSLKSNQWDIQWNRIKAINQQQGETLKETLLALIKTNLQRQKVNFLTVKEQNFKQVSVTNNENSLNFKQIEEENKQNYVKNQVSKETLIKAKMIQSDFQTTPLRDSTNDVLNSEVSYRRKSRNKLQTIRRSASKQRVIPHIPEVQFD